MALVNKKAVKLYALGMSQKYRNGKFTRVSQRFVDTCDDKMKGFVAEYVRNHPTVGKTIM